MNPLKSEVKILTAESIGRKMEEFVAAARKKQQRQQGAKEGFEHASKQMEGIMDHVDKDVENGVVDELVGEPLRIANYAKRYIQRCVGVTDSLAKTAEVTRLMAGGEEKAFDDANKFVNGIWHEEKKKLENFVKALEEMPSEDSQDFSDKMGKDDFGLPWKAKRKQEEEKEEKKVVKKKGRKAKKETEEKEIVQDGIKSSKKSLSKKMGQVKKKNITKAS